MSLNHRFRLVATDDGARAADGAEIVLGDDLLRYFHDALQWVPSENPARAGEPGMGLNYWGPTTIGTRGAACLRDVCAAWADLLALGPPMLQLTGPFTFPTDRPAEGRFQKLAVERDALVGDLRRLAGWASAVLTDPRLQIEHQGI